MAASLRNVCRRDVPLGRDGIVQSRRDRAKRPLDDSADPLLLFAAAALLAGVHLQRAGVPHTTPNDLRRTYSTRLRACGLPNELIAPTMGHKNTRMLDRVYAGLPPAILRTRLLQALGIQDAKPAPAPCSAGAVDASSQAGRIGQDGREGETVTLGSGSPEDTDLERSSLGGPRIKHLRALFVIESGARSRSRTLSVLTACEYRGGLTQERVGEAAAVFWRHPLLHS